MNDIANAGSYVYATGSETGLPVAVDAWGVSQPSGNGGQCAFINNGSAAVWGSRSCSGVLQFVVEYECPIGFAFNATGCQGL